MQLIKDYIGEIPLELVNCIVFLLSYIPMNIRVLEYHIDILLKIVLLSVTIIYTIIKAFNEYKKNGKDRQDNI